MKQAVELHTFRADHEKRTKASKGFFKLNNDSIATIHEDLRQITKPLRTAIRRRWCKFWRNMARPSWKSPVTPAE